MGAILTQNTAWRNVEKAITNLEAAGALTISHLAELPQDALAELIRPAGYYNVKAKRLKAFIRLLTEEFGDHLEPLLSLEIGDMRQRLLSVNGVGMETADCIILYAAHKPIFVVDAYTNRVLERHGLLPAGADYTSVQELFHAALPRNVELFNDFHAQFVAVGSRFCKTKPLCADCPLCEGPADDGKPPSSTDVPAGK